MSGQVHFEVFVRKTAVASWALELATEDRKVAMQLAEDVLADKRAVSVRVTKETLDPDTMEYASVTLLTRGAPEPPRPKIVRDDKSFSACTAPQDLYAPHARELVGRCLEDWLARSRVTCFELMHRPDLVEKLEASGVEYQHALQKIAVPESQATGQAVHDLMRHYQRLADQAMERVVRAGRRGLFPDLSREPVAEVARRLADEPDRAFLMGGAVCGFIAETRGWRAKLDRLMDLADAAPAEPQPRALVQVTIEQLVCEMMNLREGVAEILGPSLDLGGGLAAMVRMAAPGEVEALIRMNPRLDAAMPRLEGPAERLNARMSAGEYRLLAASFARRVVRELMGPRRLRPADAVGEIEILRALATALTASAGRLLTLEEVQLAFVERSKAIVTADFVEAYLGKNAPALAEAEALVRLCENVTGGTSKRAAARWLAASVTALRFEKEVRAAPEPAGQRLAALAALQRGARGCGLPEKETTEICAAIGVVAGAIEADGRLLAQLLRSPAPLPHKLGLLLRMAAGEAAPLGPCADRAKLEAMRLLRAPETRAAAQQAPEAFGALRGLMQAAGLAA